LKKLFLIKPVYWDAQKRWQRKKAVSAIPTGSKYETRWICIYCKWDDTTTYVEVCEFLRGIAPKPRPIPADRFAIDVTNLADIFTVDRRNKVRKKLKISAQTDGPFWRYRWWKYRYSAIFGVLFRTILSRKFPPFSKKMIRVITEIVLL